MYRDTIFHHGDRKTNLKSIWNFKIFEKYFWKHFWKFSENRKSENFITGFELKKFRFSDFPENFQKILKFPKISTKFWIFRSRKLFKNIFKNIFQIFWNFRSTWNWFCDLRGEKVFLDRLARNCGCQNKYVDSLFFWSVNSLAWYFPTF